VLLAGKAYNVKIFVIHNKKGTISGVFASALPNVGISVSEDRQVYTFEKDELPNAELKTYLSDLHSNWRVQMTRGQSELKRKNKPTKLNPSSSVSAKAKSRASKRAK
jgi:hypothetical protein